MEKAQKEIDRLEADATEPQPTTSSRRTHESARKPATANQSVNGTASAEAEFSQEKDAAADAAEDLNKASIEDQVEA